MSRFVLSLFLLVGFAFCLPSVNAQITTPQPSPESTLQQKVGLTDVEIVYCRPSKKGREIYGGLVPFGEIWRTGANASTKISFSNNVVLGGQEIPAGKYALYAIPGESSWTIIIHGNTTYWGVGDYKQEDDIARFEIKPAMMKETVETMTFQISDLTMDSANIELVWENTRVSIPLKVEVDALVEADIEKALQGVTPGTYYTAASYYLEAGKDMDQALSWINSALEKEEKFWYVRKKALILAELGRYKEAITAAERSRTLAEEADYPSYVKSNTESIEEWKKKMK